MKKKFCFGIVLLIICLGVVGCNRDNYNEALLALDSSDYDLAYTLFSEVSLDYKDTAIYVKKLETYAKNYRGALSDIENGNYDEALKLLNELPDNYKWKDELCSNMEKLKVLLNNKWEDKANGTDANSGWAYYDSYSVFVFGDIIELDNNEKEYSDGVLTNDYNDKIPLYDLLGDGVADVVSDERDNFTLDINNILNGSYEKNTDYFNTTYVIK